MAKLGEKVAVLGLGQSGFESALFLQLKGFDVFASDGGQSDGIEKNVQTLRIKGIKAESGGHSKEKIVSSDWVLISPGISPNSDIYKAVKETGMPILSEIEVASRYCKSSNVIAVTGTCGKTTVATLLYQMLNKAGFPVVVCGNIGMPWIGRLNSISAQHFVVVEVSSFQLAHCYEFRPRYAILTNISSNHEDWHGTMKSYVDAKKRLFQNQNKEDVAVLRKGDYERYAKDSVRASRLVFYDELSGRDENEQLLLATGTALNIPPCVVDSTLKGFSGIEHRLEEFTSAMGVRYVNDSKCTTTASLQWALRKFPDGKVILIAGGRAKSSDFSDARDLIREKTKKTIVIGEATGKLTEAWKKVTTLTEAADLETAVAAAYECSKEGDVVLLSPACASFDMFADYEARGKAFKNIVFNRLGVSKQVLS